MVVSTVPVVPGEVGHSRDAGHQVLRNGEVGSDMAALEVAGLGDAGLEKVVLVEDNILEEIGYETALRKAGVVETGRREKEVGLEEFAAVESGPGGMAVLSTV